MPLMAPWLQWLAVESEFSPVVADAVFCPGDMSLEVQFRHRVPNNLVSSEARSRMEETMQGGELARAFAARPCSVKDMAA